MSVSQMQFLRRFQANMDRLQRNCPHVNMTRVREGLTVQKACQACGLKAPNSVFRALRRLSRLPLLVVTGVFIPTQAACAEAGHSHLNLKGVGEVKGLLRRLYECSRCRALLPKEAFERARQLASALASSEGTPTHCRPMHGED